MRLELTPWARAAIDSELQQAIWDAAPEDAEMHVGRGVEMWRAVVTLHGHVIADVRERDLNVAAREALESV